MASPSNINTSSPTEMYPCPTEFNVLDFVPKLLSARDYKKWKKLMRDFIKKRDEEEENRITRYLPLHKAVVKGDWDEATRIIQQDPAAVRAAITSFSETALHVAIETGGRTHLVRMLLEEMTPHDVEHLGKKAVNADVALTMLERKPELAKSPPFDILVRKVSSFPSGNSFNLWHNLIYLVPSNPDEYKKLGSFPATESPTRFIAPDETISKYSILIADDNFSYGSSREHAPLALGAAGVAAGVTESYERIFFQNSVSTGEEFQSNQRALQTTIMEEAEEETLSVLIATSLVWL
ncbi:hypothetical protein RHSIM_Rhsim03G0103100 [Rhododendron simsii]|uniref:Aconitase A/isopropylmalate dehydratase small subunit swivel domain-containing protein n=1 Tax=Rhododendron simsii TaxID=118357 RepID=A0A834H8A2_RHOSS|nr:hypothetical protein RHSIM_Rhsim03G0103100 [Rhododendron simsii]